MKDGKYFRIPENHVDLERLWYEAELLDPNHLPSWLCPPDAPRYRFAGSASWPNPFGPGREDYFGEIEQLQAAGLVVDQDPAGRQACRFYVAAPTSEVVYSIGIYVGDSPFTLGPPPGVENPAFTREQVTDLRAAFVADPFLFRDGDTWHLFFEVLDGRTNKGEIGLATSTDAFHWTYRQIVLREPFHLSYPHVFRWQGEYYMMPETYQTNAVRLYRGDPFPTRWTFAATLLRLPYVVDATVFRYEERWWMLADTSEEFRNDTLRLFHASELTGPWEEHPRSPLIQGDACIARPAGRVHEVGGGLVRFAQSGVPYYGTSVRAFEITRLTLHEYEERALADHPILGPTHSGWNACGMHHIDVHHLEDGHWIAAVDGWTSPEILRDLLASS